METITKLQDNSSKVKIDVCSLSIKRNASTGVTLKIKSPMFANFFKEHEIYTNGNSVFIEGTQTTERLRRHGLTPSNRFYSNFNVDTEYLKSGDGIINLNFLTEERIGTGVEFNIVGRYSVEALNDFKTQFKEAVTKFYIENLQDVKIDLEIQVLRDSE